MFQAEILNEWGWGARDGDKYVITVKSTPAVLTG